jgi:hypothetical protein
MIVTNGIGPIKGGPVQTITGEILNEEFPTLFSQPHTILPSIGGAYIVLGYILELNWTVRASASLGLGYSPLIILNGINAGSISWLRLGSLPGSGYFSGGAPHEVAAANISTGAPLVWMMDADDAVGQYETAFYQIWYTITNPV